MTFEPSLRSAVQHERAAVRDAAHEREAAEAHAQILVQAADFVTHGLEEQVRPAKPRGRRMRARRDDRLAVKVYPEEIGDACFFYLEPPFVPSFCVLTDDGQLLWGLSRNFGDVLQQRFGLYRKACPHTDAAGAINAHPPGEASVSIFHANVLIVLDVVRPQRSASTQLQVLPHQCWIRLPRIPLQEDRGMKLEGFNSSMPRTGHHHVSAFRLQSDCELRLRILQAYMIRQVGRFSRGCHGPVRHGAVRVP